VSSPTDGRSIDQRSAPARALLERLAGRVRPRPPGFAPRGERRQRGDRSNEHDALHCATKWAGFSDDDVGTAVAALQDLSNFPALVDGMLQGFMQQLVLGRLMLADNGLVSEPEFQRDDGTALFDNATIVDDGNSQGGIFDGELIDVCGNTAYTADVS